jgi:hypothetical protein
LKDLRPAFTIIEILISVIIISFSIVLVLKIHSQNHEQIIYISERNKLSLEDSLFLTDNVLQYHKESREAYEILQSYFKINDFKSRQILKKAKRDFFIPEPIRLTQEEGEGEGSGPSATVKEIKLKNKYSSSYFHFKIDIF